MLSYAVSGRRSGLGHVLVSLPYHTKRERRTPNHLTFITFSFAQFDLNTGGRIQRHCQEVRSKLEDLIEDRRVEHRHVSQCPFGRLDTPFDNDEQRSPLQVVYEYFMPPVRSSVIPGPVGNALSSILV